MNEESIHILIHNGILLSQKMEGNYSLGSNTGTTRDYHTK